MDNKTYYKITNNFFLELEEDLTQYFFKGTTINPLKIITISSEFQKLSLKSENLLLLYSTSKSIKNIDVIITTKKIHLKNDVISIENFNSEFEKTETIPQKHLEILKEYTNTILSVKKEKNKDIEYFTNKFKAFINEKENANYEFDISIEFLKILKNEGEKIKNLVDTLNKDETFLKTINTIIENNDKTIHFKTEHVVLQDIIKIYNKIVPLSNKELPTKHRINFLLAYLFEKLQGKDLISSLSTKKINSFVKTSTFEDNIEIIKKAKLFNLGEKYKDDFLLPLLLKRTKNQYFSESSVLLYRIASLIAKADETISEEEAKALKQINEKLMHPKIKLQGVTKTETNENETLNDVLDELNELVGLENIKTAVKELANFLKIQKLRDNNGLKPVNNSLHSVFMGPPGTGKTTIARLISKIYKHLGYLEKGHLIETDRSGLVAGYVGQTALKVDEVINTSINGVLFIDEAYALSSGNNKDFGNEAIETLLKKMEDHREELVVIVAGYNDQMKNFINSNPGLQSRFNRYYTFKHYTPQELVAIFNLFCKKNDFIVTDSGKEKLEFIFEKLYEKRDENFGNARVVRNLFEKIIEYQANRIINITPITKSILKTITEEDIPAVNKTINEYLAFKEQKL